MIGNGFELSFSVPQLFYAFMMGINVATFIFSLIANSRAGIICSIMSFVSFSIAFNGGVR